MLEKKELIDTNIEYCPKHYGFNWNRDVYSVLLYNSN